MAFQGRYNTRDDGDSYSLHIALGSCRMSTAAEDVESLSTVDAGANARERALFERVLFSALSPMPFQLTSPADSMPGSAVSRSPHSRNPPLWLHSEPPAPL